MGLLVVIGLLTAYRRHCIIMKSRDVSRLARLLCPRDNDYDDDAVLQEAGGPCERLAGQEP